MTKKAWINLAVYLSRKLGFRISFAQSGEDTLIAFIFMTLGIERPSYIDIGAFHPYKFSNTAMFYLTGSRGINIEPNPQQFSHFEIARKRDINLNIGIAEQEAEIPYYKFNVPTLNTFSKAGMEETLKVDPNYKLEGEVSIPVSTIKSVLDKYWDGRFPDILSLDVEGLDMQILNTIDYENNSPKVICVESISHSPHGAGVKADDLIEYVKSKGYMLYADTNINSIFVKKSLWLNH